MQSAPRTGDQKATVPADVLGNTVKRRTGIILAAVLIVGVSFFLIRAVDDRSTDDMVSRADRLAIPSAWSQLDNIVRREQFLCISTNPCPSIARRWDTGTELTPADLQAIAAPASLALKVDGTCQRRPNSGGNIPVCTGTATDGDYDYRLAVASPGPGEPVEFILEVKPASG